MMMIGNTMGMINAIRNIADYNHAKDIIKLMETLKAFERKIISRFAKIYLNCC